jgi:hypothetical protein
MVMMDPPLPCCTICWAAAWQVKNTPFKLTASTASKSSSVISRKGAAFTMPAGNTNMLCGINVPWIALGLEVVYKHSIKDPFRHS